MEFGDVRSEATKKTQSYGKLIVEWEEATMSKMQRQGKYGEANYGCPQH